MGDVVEVDLGTIVPYEGVCSKNLKMGNPRPLGILYRISHEYFERKRDGLLPRPNSHQSVRWQRYRGRRVLQRLNASCTRHSGLRRTT